MEVDEVESKAIWCSICLSTDRNLTNIRSLPELLETYKLIMSDTDGIFCNSMDHHTCWECESILKKLYRIKRQGQLAHQHLISLKDGGREIPRTLSRLVVSRQGEINIYSQEVKPRREWKVPTIIPADVKLCEITINSKGEPVIVNAEQCTQKDSEVLNDQSCKSLINNIVSKEEDKSSLDSGYIEIKLEKIDCDNDQPDLASEQDKKETPSYTEYCMSETERLAIRHAVKLKSNYMNSPHKCQLCFIGFANRQQLMDHFKMVHCVRPGKILCTICYASVREENIQCHTKEHYMRYTCSSCSHIKYSKNEMEIHLRRHNTVKTTRDLKKRRDRRDHSHNGHDKTGNAAKTRHEKTTRDLKKRRDRRDHSHNGHDKTGNAAKTRHETTTQDSKKKGDRQACPQNSDDKTASAAETRDEKTTRDLKKKRDRRDHSHNSNDKIASAAVTRDEKTTQDLKKKGCLQDNDDKAASAAVTRDEKTTQDLKKKGCLQDNDDKAASAAVTRDEKTTQDLKKKGCLQDNDDKAASAAVTRDETTQDLKKKGCLQDNDDKAASAAVTRDEKTTQDLKKKGCLQDNDDKAASAAVTRDEKTTQDLKKKGCLQDNDDKAASAAVTRDEKTTQDLKKKGCLQDNDDKAASAAVTRDEKTTQDLKKKGCLQDNDDKAASAAVTRDENRKSDSDSEEIDINDYMELVTVSNDDDDDDDKSKTPIGIRKRLLKCKFCTKTFKTRGCFDYHRLTHLSGATCLECAKVCVNSKVLWKHMKKSHGSGYKEKCGKCCRMFYSPDGFEKHVESHKKDKINYCNLCQKFYKSVASFRRHLKVAIAHQLVKGRTYSCEPCEKMFDLEANYKRHMTVVHGASKHYKCDTCNKEYIRRSALSAHIQIKHQNKCRPKNKVCEVCGYQCKTNQELHLHMTRHNAGRSHVCTECDIVYSKADSLMLHMKRVHEK